MPGVSWRNERASMSNEVILWDQHQVGDAGFLGEQRLQAFYKRDRNAPWIFLPVARGARVIDIFQSVEEKFGTALVLIEFSRGRFLTARTRG